jgi:hypothetical protein
MDDVSRLLERAASTPTTRPDLVRATRRARRARATATAVAAAAFAVLLALGVYAMFRPTTPRARVSVEPTTVPSATSEYRDDQQRFSIEVPSGWFRAERRLEPWLVSPHEILSIATVPLSPSPLPGNQAACYSEIPRVAVDGIGRDGAYIWIGEWIPGQGLYTAEPRTAHAADLTWQPECPLPNGITAKGATFRDQGRDFSVHVVRGANASARLSQIYAMLDTLRVDPAPDVIRQRCATPDAINVDIDGDGRPDRVYYGFFTPLTGARLGVCLASGAVSEITDLGPPEALGVVSVPGRRAPVILYGGTTAYSVIVFPAVIDAGALARVTLPDRTNPAFESGSDPADLSHSRMFGCTTVGTSPALVQLDAWKLPNGTSKWQRTTYLLRGTSATATTDRGTVDATDRASLRSLVPACHVLASPGFGQTFGQ